MSLVRLAIRVRPADAEEALAALLPVLGGGAEERDVKGAVEYALYGPAGELPDEAELRRLAGDALVGVSVEPVADGWETRWHAFLRPVRVGPLTIRPPWVAGATGDLVISPGTCFGAGTHPTTRLCLALLLDAAPGGALCDWGAGTGILAVAAARSGWGPVTAIERDAAALPVIRANARANDVAVRAREGDVTASSPPWAPTVTANLTRPVLLAAAAALDRPPSTLIAAGFLATDVAPVLAAFAAHGMREADRRVEGEWAAVVLEAA